MSRMQTRERSRSRGRGEVGTSGEGRVSGILSRVKAMKESLESLAKEKKKEEQTPDAAEAVTVEDKALPLLEEEKILPSQLDGKREEVSVKKEISGAVSLEDCDAGVDEDDFGLEELLGDIEKIQREHRREEMLRAEQAEKELKEMGEVDTWEDLLSGIPYPVRHLLTLAASNLPALLGSGDCPPEALDCLLRVGYYQRGEIGEEFLESVEQCHKLVKQHGNLFLDTPPPPLGEKKMGEEVDIEQLLALASLDLLAQGDGVDEALEERDHLRSKTGDISPMSSQSASIEAVLRAGVDGLRLSSRDLESFDDSQLDLLEHYYYAPHVEENELTPLPSKDYFEQQKRERDSQRANMRRLVSASSKSGLEIPKR